MPLYRVIHGTVGHRNRTHHPGDTLELPDYSAAPLIATGQLVLVEPPAEEKDDRSPLPPAMAYTREELQAMYQQPDGWRQIKEIALALTDLTKAPDGGWDAAIDLILEAQGNNG